MLFLILSYCFLTLLNDLVHHEKQLIGYILDVFSLIVCLTRLVPQLSQPLLVPIVVVVEQFILVIVLERDKRSLKSVKVEKLNSTEVELCDLHGQGFQGKFDVNLVFGGASNLYEHELVQKAADEHELFSWDVST